MSDQIGIPIHRHSDQMVWFRMVGHQRIIPICDPSLPSSEIEMVVPIAMMTDHAIQHFLTETDRGISTLSKAINRLQEYNEDRMVRMREIADMIFPSQPITIDAISQPRAELPIGLIERVKAIFWRSLIWVTGLPTEQFSRVTIAQSEELIARYSHRMVFHGSSPICFKTYTHPWVINWRVGDMVYWIPKGTEITQQLLHEILHDPGLPIRSPVCVSVDASMTVSLEFLTGMMILDAPLVRS
jgi:hypothetical protein